MTQPDAFGRHLRAVTTTPGDTVHEPSPDPVQSDPTGHGPDRSAPAGTGDDAAAEAFTVAEIGRARAALPAIDPAVFDCYLGGLVESVADYTEGDPVNVLASLLCFAGVHLGQGPHVRAGDDLHPLLVWPLVIGRTNSGRKGAGWSSARRLAVAAAPDFMVTNQRSGLTSGEGLANLFTDTPEESTENDDPAARGKRRAGGRLPPGDRRLLVVEPEWAGVMERMRREGNSLSATLRAGWEGGDLSTLAVTARVAPESHVGILGHITPEEFRAKVSASDLAGGTYNRFLPVMVSRARFLPGGQGAPDMLVKGIGAELAERLDQGGQLGAIGFTAAGNELWRRLYVEFGTDTGDVPAVEQFISRAAPYCLRIAAIHTALDGATAIDTRHLLSAAALVRYSIASARTALSNDQAAAKLLRWIADAGAAGRSRDEIREGFCHKHKRANDDARRNLVTLVEAGRLVVGKRPAAGKGRPTEVYTAVQVPRDG
ncbi:YfjI family protein [Amycolatopsis sp. NBC_01307]|uniref:DUF3987 domain-containing protein n=1 Tax=Amycolatopsis sp. NBC_01307 TaxID=2903561 RepID=UPI002E13566B|nr:YfjI family protein [Amycolatopsis sp. NBC_01307]